MKRKLLSEKPKARQHYTPIDFVVGFSDLTRQSGITSLESIREFKIFDATVAKTSLKIASSSFSIYFAIMSVC